jgi:hypothetical protein
LRIRLTRRSLLLGASLTLPGSTDSGSSRSTVPQKETACDRLLLATSPLPPGSPLIGNEITIRQVSTAAVTSFPWTQPGFVMPLELPGMALARSLGGLYAVIDTVEMSVHDLDFPGVGMGEITHDHPKFTGSRGTRFVLFGAGPGKVGFLVDLQERTTRTLADFVPPGHPVVRAEVATGDQRLLLETGSSIFLVDLPPQEGVRTPISESRSWDGRFSADGAALAYLEESESDDVSICSIGAASGTSIGRSKPGSWQGLPALPAGAIFAIRDARSLHRIESLEGGISTLPVEFPDGAWEPHASTADANRVVARSGAGNDVRWALVDFETGSATTLDPTQGLAAARPDQPVDWFLFAPSLDEESGMAGAPYLLLELTSGTLQPILQQDGPSIYSLASGSRDFGRYHLVQSVATAQSRLWLIDGVTGTADLIGVSTGNVPGVLSPGGCYLAINEFDALGEGRQGHVLVIDLATPQPVAEVLDSVLLGWASD